jgi:hypothetical protein
MLADVVEVNVLDLVVEYMVVTPLEARGPVSNTPSWRTVLPVLLM